MSLRGSYSRRGRGPALTSFPGRLVVGWRASGDAAVPLSAWSPALGKLGARSRVDSADVGRQTHLIRGDCLTQRALPDGWTLSSPSRGATGTYMRGRSRERDR